MVIFYGKRMTAVSVAHSKVTLEIHLPQIVGEVSLKPLEWYMADTLFRGYETIALQDRCYS